MIKVSVIIPIYNAEQYLKQCIDSVVNQTLQDIEIILVNDASTDGSLDICKQYEASDKRVKLIDKPVNQGLAAARNTGMEVCTGEYIAFLDADDWMELDAYERIYSVAHANNSDMVFYNCMENEDGHRFSKFMRCGAFDREQIKKEILPRTLSGINEKGGKGTIRWCNWLRFYKREMIERNALRFDDRFRRCQDLQLTYEATLCAQSYYYMGDDYLLHNRVVSDSLSRGYTKNMWSLLCPLIERLYSDTKGFKEMDLMPQMHLCCFFFAVDTIQNELKEASPHDKKGRLLKIDEIINDSLVKGCLPHIEYSKFDEYYIGMYKAVSSGDAQKVYDFYFSFKKSRARKLAWRKFTAKLTGSKVFGIMYIWVRCLFDKKYKEKANKSR